MDAHALRGLTGMFPPAVAAPLAEVLVEAEALANIEMKGAADGLRRFLSKIDTLLPQLRAGIDQTVASLPSRHERRRARREMESLPRVLERHRRQLRQMLAEAEKVGRDADAAFVDDLAEVFG